MLQKRRRHTAAWSATQSVESYSAVSTFCTRATVPVVTHTLHRHLCVLTFLILDEANQKFKFQLQ